MARCLLLPLRDTSLNAAKLAAAGQQARALDAALLLLHVLPQSALQPDAVTPAEATARAFLDGVAAELRAASLRAETLVCVGVPAETIIAQAVEQHALLIILGNSVRARLPRALLGSVADEVIQHAPCPVLLVRTEVLPVRDHSPLPLNPPDLLVPRALGLRTVDVARIVGSATRAHELTTEFRALHASPQDEQLFQNIRAGLARGDDLPPAELYKLGFGYYVRDGHHRVAAARQLHRAAVQAHVTELAPLDEPTEHLFHARAVFEEETGLTQVGATAAEHYAELRAQIEACQEEWGSANLIAAAERWYHEVFRPLREQVRALGLAQRTPGERPADLIARAGAWRLAERARTGALPTWDRALEHGAKPVAQAG